jgi:hypothetical protein
VFVVPLGLKELTSLLSYKNETVEKAKKIVSTYIERLHQIVGKGANTAGDYYYYFNSYVCFIFGNAL